MLQGTPQEVREAVVTCLDEGGRRSISAAGCEIPDGTPTENLRAQAQALREYGARGAPS
jgi:uroporphyrinogen-III decarboxylase